MTTPFHLKEIALSMVETEFAVARSKCVDAFARLEFLVGLAARQLGLPVNRDCLGRRIASLAKADAKLLPAWIEQTERLVAQRASLVHAEMAIGNFESGWKASFANASDRIVGNSTALLMDLEMLHALRGDVDVQAKRLSELVKGLPEAA